MVPVPTVLAWATKQENCVGIEFMIQDAVPGVPLKDVWADMTTSQHVACIRSIGRLCKQLCSLNFPAYGSLYLNTEAPSGAMKLDDVFCIGPMCAPQHWNRGIDRAAGTNPPSGCQGPWHNVRDYFSDLITRARLSLSMDRKEAEMSYCELLHILQQSLDLLTNTEAVENASGPILFHPDLHARNILVDAEDHTKITGIIDWQAAAVEPAFVFAAEAPDFAEGRPDDVTAEEQAANIELRTDVDFCVGTWIVMQQACEKLCPASGLDADLLQLLAAPSFGWIDKGILLELVLNNLANKREQLGLEQLGLPARSLYRPSEAGDVLQRLDEYQTKCQVRDHLIRLLRCDNDGWVAKDRWEEVLSQYRL